MGFFLREELRVVETLGQSIKALWGAGEVLCSPEIAAASRGGGCSPLPCWLSRQPLLYWSSWDQWGSAVQKLTMSFGPRTEQRPWKASDRRKHGAWLSCREHPAKGGWAVTPAAASSGVRQQDRLEELKSRCSPSQGICWMPGAACLAATEIAHVDFDDVGPRFKSFGSCGCWIKCLQN